MINQIDQMVYKSSRPLDKINAIYYPYDGLVDNEFMKLTSLNTCIAGKSNLRHEWRSDLWDSKINFIDDLYRNRTCLDICIANNRQGQAYHGYNIASRFHIPLVIIDHEPLPGNSKTKLIDMHNPNMPNDSVFVAADDFIAKQWHYENSDSFNIIPYAIECEDYSDLEKDNDFIFIGDYADEDMYFIEDIKSMCPNIECIGYNKNTKEFSSMQSLRKSIAKSKISISASQGVKPPILQLISASLGTVVFVSSSEWVESVFKHGETAFIYESLSSLKELISDVIKDKGLMNKISSNAKEMVQDKYNFERNSKLWNDFLTNISNKVYTR